MSIRYFTCPKTFDVKPPSFDYEKAMRIAKMDPVFYKHEVYELIGGASIYLNEEINFPISDGGMYRSDILVFRDVHPHIDEDYVDIIHEGDVECKTYFAHLFLHGTGVFKSFNSKNDPDKVTSAIPFKPGTVILMNQRIKHAVDTDEFVFSYCEERFFHVSTK